MGDNRTENGKGRRVAVLLSLVLGAIALASCQSPLDALRPISPPTKASSAQAAVGNPATGPRYPDLSDLVDAHPAEVDNSRLPVTPVEALHTTGWPPEVDINTYRLKVEGLVEKPLALTYEQILAYPARSEVVLLICPGVFVDNAQWTGVPIAALLAEAGARPGATAVTFHAMDGYQQTLPLEVASQEGVFLAHTVNDETLPLEHGYPVRLVVEDRFGGEWVKWVERIEVR